MLQDSTLYAKLLPGFKNSRKEAQVAFPTLYAFAVLGSIGP